MSIFQKTFVFLHHLYTSGAKSAKKQLCSRAMQDKTRNKMKILHTLRLDRMKWRHWVLLLLLILVTLTKMIPLGSYLHPPLFIPVIAAFFRPSQAFSPLPWAIFSLLSASPGSSYPIYEIGLQRNLAINLSFLLPRAVAIRKKRRFRKGN